MFFCLDMPTAKLLREAADTLPTYPLQLRLHHTTLPAISHTLHGTLVPTNPGTNISPQVVVLVLCILWMVCRMLGGTFQDKARGGSDGMMEEVRDSGAEPRCCMNLRDFDWRTRRKSYIRRHVSLVYWMDAVSSHFLSDSRLANEVRRWTSDTYLLSRFDLAQPTRAYYSSYNLS